MAAANASARIQRQAILASPLAELTGFLLVVDCGALSVGRQAILCPHSPGCLLRATHDGTRGIAPYTVRAGLRWTLTVRLAGNGPDAEPACQAAPGAAVGA